MPLGRVFAEMVADLRDRVEVSWHHDRWHVTASSFDAALDYVGARFDDAAVLARHDHGRRWTRVTLEVSTDPALATKAPPLTELAHPPPPSATPQAVSQPPMELREAEPVAASDLPTDLEAIFAHQDALRRR
ncbi:MAG: hypothetical protein WAV00_02665 [Nocardioides sp.]